MGIRFRVVLKVRSRNRVIENFTFLLGIMEN